jgi:uncharacterized membrane protein YdbT with pleckstrin-like domain
MAYIEKILDPGETVVHRAKLHWIIYIPPLSFFILGILIPKSQSNSILLALGTLSLLIGIVGFVRALIAQYCTEIAVTNRRVIVKRGLIKRDTIEINAVKIESVDVRQSMPGRLLDYGTVVIRGTGGHFSEIADVRDPLALRRSVSPMITGARESAS